MHIFVHADATARSDVEPGVHGQSILGPHPNAHDHQLRRQDLARLQLHEQARLVLGEALGGILEQDGHPVRLQRLEDRRCHFLVERRQHLLLQLDHRGRHAAADKILNQFQTDKPGPDHDCVLDSPVNLCLDAINVVQVSQREDSRQVDAGQRWLYRSRAARE